MSAKTNDKSESSHACPNQHSTARILGRPIHARRRQRQTRQGGCAGPAQTLSFRLLCSVCCLRCLSPRVFWSEDRLLAVRHEAWETTIVALKLVI